MGGDAHTPCCRGFGQWTPQHKLVALECTAWRERCVSAQNICNATMKAPSRAPASRTCHRWRWWLLAVTSTTSTRPKCVIQIQQRVVQEVVECQPQLFSSLSTYAAFQNVPHKSGAGEQPAVGQPAKRSDIKWVNDITQLSAWIPTMLCTHKRVLRKLRVGDLGRGTARHAEGHLAQPL